MPLVTDDTDRYATNRAEISHQPTRQRERQMRGFKSPISPPSNFFGHFANLSQPKTRDLGPGIGASSPDHHRDPASYFAHTPDERAGRSDRED